jgi:O-acetyl-ADP-ribose deacetylase (regulator of RNase III)
MIIEVTGDILLSKAQLVAHGVAPDDHFTNGLALALREQWPAMHKDFRHYCHINNPQPGTLWVWAAADGRRIANLLTQTAAQQEHGHGASHGHPGRAHLDHVNHALRELRKFVTEEKIKTIALPRLATGVGGLSWDEVRPLIQHHLGESGAKVYVYSTYKKGVPAAET